MPTASIRRWASLFLVVTLIPGLARADSSVFNLYVAYGDNVGVFNTASQTAVNADLISIPGPTGLAFGPDGDLYVGSAFLSGDLAAGIVRYDPATGASLGTLVSHVTDNNLNNPAGMAFGPDGKLYVADITGSFVLSYDHNGVPGTPITGPQVIQPTAVDFHSGSLYVASGSGDVLKYSGNQFTAANNSPGVFVNPTAVTHAGGNLFVLNVGGNSGIFELNPNTGATQKIVDFSTSPFFPSTLTAGPDGNLYVGGLDADNGDGEVLEYGEDGSGGSEVLNLGFNADPTAMTFDSVPETALMAPLTSLLALGCVFYRRGRSTR